MPLAASLTPLPRLILRAIAGGMLAGLVVWLAYSGLGLGKGAMDGFIEDWLSNAVLFAGAVLLLARAALVRSERWAWLAFGVGVLVWNFGDIYYSVAFGTGEAAFPSPADALWLASYPALYAGLMLLVHIRIERFLPSLWLDGLIGGLAVAALGSVFVLQPVLESTVGSFAAVATNIAYPFADLVLFASVILLFALHGWRPGAAILLLSLGLALNAVADSVYLYEAARDTYVDGSLVDPLWGAAIALISFSSWQRPRAAKADPGDWWLVIVPLLFAIGAVSLLVYGNLKDIGTFPLVLTTLAVVAAMVRAGLTFKEIRSLTDSRRQARTDELTGLPNRRYFYEQVAEEIKAAEEVAGVFCVVVIDLDRFKVVNETLGHRVGDSLLRHIGPRLKDLLRPADTLARVGGDEFAIVLQGSGAPDAVRLTERLQAAFDRPWAARGLLLHTEGSMGIARFPDDGHDPDTLFQRAEVAMSQAKRNRTGCELYAPEQDVHTRESVELLGELRRALAEEELVLYFQPKVAIPTGEVTGVEALLRWQHPTRGILGPLEFLPAAEQTALMRPITLYVIERALRQCAGWRWAGHPLTVAVNLSASNLLDVTLPDEVVRLLKTTGAQAPWLELEITENAVMADPERAVEVISGLRALGISLSIDDFGTGYSSLAYLKRLAVDELKIDRSFVMNMEHDSADAAIVRSTIDLGRNLGLRVVAEGVETDGAWRILEDCRCDLAQGYLISRPLPADELSRWLSVRHPVAA
jgi:diguanylate cyclase (GGDEF)-like protein